MTDPDLVVLRTGIHGMPTSTYAATLDDRLPEHEVELATTPEEERRLVEHTPVIAGQTIGEELLEHATDLQLFACSSAGYNHPPMDALDAHDVAVTTASGVHGPNIAEDVLGFILTLTRRHHEAWRRKRRRQWRAYPVGELADSTVTVVGLGAIGTAITERLAGFDVHTIGVRHSPEKGGPTDEVLGTDELRDALARSEYVVLAVPLTDETEGLIAAPELDTLPPEAVVVNVARGPVVDTDALVDALHDNAIGGAALDVTDPEPLPESHPLWGFENVLITPHNTGNTPNYYDRLADIVVENIQRVAETGEYANLRNQVR